MKFYGYEVDDNVADILVENGLRWISSCIPIISESLSLLSCPSLVWFWMIFLSHQCHSLKCYGVAGLRPTASGNPGHARLQENKMLLLKV